MKRIYNVVLVAVMIVCAFYIGYYFGSQNDLSSFEAVTAEIPDNLSPKAEVVRSHGFIPEVKYPLPDWFIDSLISIESKGDNSAVGDGGDAIGVLQITPIFVKECNRIAKIYKLDTEYTLKDRWDVCIAIEMTQLHSKHWGKHFTKKYDIGYPELIQIHRWSANWRSNKMNNIIDNQRDIEFKEYVEFEL